MTFNAMTEHYEEITVCGKPALFTSIRIRRDTIPDGLYLHQRTREGLLTARLNGKQVGRKKGVGFETKKAREAKQIIRTHCKTFGGTLDDAECMKLTGLARNTYYKYKRQIRAELMAEQDLPKGASIFYEPPKSF